MEIVDFLQKMLGRKYQMNYNHIQCILTILEPIEVKDMIRLKRVIHDYKIKIKNIRVEASDGTIL